MSKNPTFRENVVTGLIGVVFLFIIALIFLGLFSPFINAMLREHICIEKGFDGISTQTDNFEGKDYIKCFKIKERLGSDTYIYEWVVLNE